MKGVEENGGGLFGRTQCRKIYVFVNMHFHAHVNSHTYMDVYAFVF